MAPRERPSSCNASRSCSSRLVARAFFLLILMAVAGGIQQKLTQGSSPHRTGRGSRATRAPSLFKRLLGPRPTHFLGSTSVWSMRCGVGTLMRLARSKSFGRVRARKSAKEVRETWGSIWDRRKSLNAKRTHATRARRERAGSCIDHGPQN